MNRTLHVRPWYTLARCLGALLLLSLVVGCGSSTGTVSGEVTYKGKPLPGGYVMFVPADANKSAVTALIDEKGHYEAPNVPVGDVKISVDNSEWKPLPKKSSAPPQLPPGFKVPAGVKLEAPPKGGEKAQSAAQKHPGAYRQIPEKYYRIDTSRLTYTVKPGSQTHPIELK